MLSHQSAEFVERVREVTQEAHDSPPGDAPSGSDKNVARIVEEQDFAHSLRQEIPRRASIPPSDAATFAQPEVTASSQASMPSTEKLETSTVGNDEVVEASPLRNPASHILRTQSPLSSLRRSIDLDSQNSEHAGYRLSQNFNVEIQPPTRGNTADDLSQPIPRASRSPLDRSSSLSPLQQSENLAPSRNVTLPHLRPRTPPPAITEGSLNDFIFPETICVIMNLTFNGEKIPEFQNDKVKSFKWTLPDEYKKLVPDNFMQKLQDAYKDMKTQDMFLRYGTCQVKGSSGLEYDSPVAIVKDHDELKDKSTMAICGFISAHPYQCFDLRVHWDYGFAQIKVPTARQIEDVIHSSNYATMIKEEIDKKMVKNFQKLQYIPRRDLDVFLRPLVIEQVVKADSSVRLSESEQKDFIITIQSSAPKLFAICVFCDFPMAFLQHLISETHRCEDILDHRPSLKMVCNQGYCTNNRIKKVVENLPGFFAEKITRNYQHRDLSHEKVLPLHDTGSMDDTGCASRTELGGGAFGKVFAAKINLAHNDDDTLQEVTQTARFGMSSGPLVLSYESPDRHFAVKELTDELAFNQEREILRRFADYPHPHIVLHLATWTQGSSSYILYDLARCNLRTYVTTVTPPGFSKAHVLWFLRQLDGLAGAIYHVHRFKRATLADPKPQPEFGRHNDIKPENILVFERVPNENPIFKIADFGQGVFTKAEGIHSRTSRNPRGTETYWAPDYHKNKGVSRPFDMFAMGCVYLELLLWFFNFFLEEGTASFTTRRQDFPGHQQSSSSFVSKEDRFWGSTGHGIHAAYFLKPAVSNVIDELKDVHCKDMPAFTGVVETVELLLKLNSTERLTAEKLTARMATIVAEATGALNRRPDYYKSHHERNTGRSDVSEKPVTEVFEHGDVEHSPISRSPSFDRVPSRGSTVRRNAALNLALGSTDHEGQSPQIGPGDLARELERLSGPSQSSEQAPGS